MTCVRTHSVVITPLHSDLYVFAPSSLLYSSQAHFFPIRCPFCLYLLHFQYACLCWSVNSMPLTQTCRHEPQKLLTTCVALSGQNSSEIGDFKSELMQHATVSSSVVQLNDLRCLLPAPLVPPPSAPMKSIELKGASESFPSRILVSKCRNPFDGLLTHPLLN